MSEWIYKLRLDGKGIISDEKGDLILVAERDPKDAEIASSIKAENERLKEFLCAEHGYSACPACIKNLVKVEKERDRYKKAIEDFLADFDRGAKRQRELLVEGQTLETASKNWEEFPEDFSIDIMPLREAIEGKGGNESHGESK